MSKETIYKDMIKLLGYLEVVVNNPKQFSVVRKQLLDTANEVLRLEVVGEGNGYS